MMTEIVQGVSVLTVVFADGSPLPFAQIWPHFSMECSPRERHLIDAAPEFLNR
jgi:hypothetical protein